MSDFIFSVQRIVTSIKFSIYYLIFAYYHKFCFLLLMFVPYLVHMITMRFMRRWISSTQSAKSTAYLRLLFITLPLLVISSSDFPMASWKRCLLYTAVHLPHTKDTFKTNILFNFWYSRAWIIFTFLSVVFFGTDTMQSNTSLPVVDHYYIKI